MTCKNSKKTASLELLKVSKVTSFKIYISPVTEKLETSNFIFGQQINTIEMVLLGTLLQAVVMTSFDQVTFNISSYRPQGLRSSMQTLCWSLTSCFKYFVIIKFSKFCRKDKCARVSSPSCRLLYLYMKQAN